MHAASLWPLSFYKLPQALRPSKEAARPCGTFGSIYWIAFLIGLWVYSGRMYSTSPRANGYNNVIPASVLALIIMLNHGHNRYGDGSAR